MASARFGTILSAMVTPFEDDGALDVDGATDLARWLVGHGHDGLVLTGTTGEAPTLTDDEKMALWRAVRQAVDVPLLAGVGTSDTRHTVELSQQAAGTDVDGLLVVVPYYNKPPQAGIQAHMRAVAAATELPIVMYDVPHRTGRSMSVDTIVRLATEVPNIVGLKDARGNPAATARVVAEAPDDFDLYSGDDALTLALLAAGAVGIIGVATHWCGEYMAEMIRAFQGGDHVQAQRINARLAPSFSYAQTELWQAPGAVKALLAELGLPSGPCRLPLPPVPDEARAWAQEVIAALPVTI